VFLFILKQKARKELANIEKNSGELSQEDYDKVFDDVISKLICMHVETICVVTFYRQDTLEKTLPSLYSKDTSK
jgi:hypothetical protein